MKIQHTEVLIIGAGPAGCAAAGQLLKAGHQVTVVEKTKFPRFVIGESLLPRCMDILEETNLLDDVKNFGFQEKFGAKFIDGDKICDFDFSEQFTKGYTWTWQVTRADFDHVLAKSIAKKGAKVLFETAVETVEFKDDHAELILSNSEGSFQINANYVIDASGYGRVLPRLLDLDAPSNMPPRTAFFSHLNDPNRPLNIDGNRIQIIVLAQKTWVWVIPFSNGNTSVGVVGDLSILDDSHSPNERFNQLINISPFLQQRFGDEKPLFTPTVIGGYSTKVKQFYGHRFVLCGNSTEFLDPVFSSGVTFALESGSKAGKLVSQSLKNQEVDWDKEYVQYMKQGIDTFRTYVEAWYDGTLQTIFFADNIEQGIKERICSVLAGYVWDLDNPYVKKHEKALKTLAHILSIQQ